MRASCLQVVAELGPMIENEGYRPILVSKGNPTLAGDAHARFERIYKELLKVNQKMAEAIKLESLPFQLSVGPSRQQ